MLYNIHGDIIEDAVERVHQLLGEEIFFAFPMTATQDYMDVSGATSPARFHFLRSAYSSSRNACLASTREIVNFVYEAFRNLERGNPMDYFTYLGRAAHTLQDSLCPAHTKRQWGNSYKKLLKVCLDIGEPVPPGSCEHYLSGDFDIGSEGYRASVRATVGLLRTAAKIERTYEKYTWEIVNQHVRDMLVKSTDQHDGYVNCDTLPTDDKFEPNPPEPICGGCKPNEKCCPPGVCVQNTSCLPGPPFAS